MDTAQQIFGYLPLKYKNPSDTAYFDFLVNSVEQNYEAENYHFGVVALHMIYMGIVYHYIYGIFRADKKRFEYILIGFHDWLKSRAGVSDFDNLSWHNFSVIDESTIFQFYRAVGIPHDQIGNLKSPVKKRNDILHTNGKHLSSEDDFEDRSQIYLQNLEKIWNFCEPEFKKLFFKFLDDIKIEIVDGNEAYGYFEQDFINEYGISKKIISQLAQIPKTEYPADKEVFFDVVKKCSDE
ncbi:hypothetical protein MYX07_04645 [Patescibacteria group bacterium AH-259-L07]|nr:hypothetical protein [Patescibacteria group bacterium AH-259-L07]